MSSLPPRFDFANNPIPASAGIGLRFEHVNEVITTRPGIAWLEVHAENYMSEGGRSRHALRQIRRDYPLSIHGVGLSIGGADALDIEHLERLRALVEEFEPGLVSEHLAWCASGGTYLNDLLPLPYNQESLARVVEHVDRTQNVLKRPILIENPSLYLRFTSAEMSETTFLNEVVRRTGCGLLLDVNNVFVSAVNLGFDPGIYLNEVDPATVREIHLAGHHRRMMDGAVVCIDDHGSAVCDEVWALYDTVIRRIGRIPTLIEWDRDIPTLDRLLGERDRAEQALAVRGGPGGSDAVAA